MVDLSIVNASRPEGKWFRPIQTLPITSFSLANLFPIFGQNILSKKVPRVGSLSKNHHLPIFLGLQLVWRKRFHHCHHRWQSRRTSWQVSWFDSHREDRFKGNGVTKNGHGAFQIQFFESSPDFWCKPKNSFCMLIWSCRSDFVFPAQLSKSWCNGGPTHQKHVISAMLWLNHENIWKRCHLGLPSGKQTYKKLLKMAQSK